MMSPIRPATLAPPDDDQVTGRRLPGFLGDTLFQTTARLQKYYRAAGLELVEEHAAPRYAGAKVFIYHTVKKLAAY